MSLLRPIADRIWIATAPVRFNGLRFTANMTVIQLTGGSLLLHSPIPFTPELSREVDALGPVAHLYSPNTYHHLRIGDWHLAHPKATLHAPRGLRKKRPDLKIDRFHDGAPDPALGDLDELPIDGFMLEERVVFHRATGTLIVADLVQNIGRPEHWFTRIYSKTFGFYDRLALSRIIRLAFTDKKAGRKSIDAVLALPIQRLIVGHGEPVLKDAKAALTEAYRWLPR
ncbi:MAG: hypothetical protein QM723_06670 [Myxococcaceae bacterium]